MLEKVKNIFSVFGHSPKMVDEKYFHWNWTHFRKIYKGSQVSFDLEGTFWTPANLQKS